MCQVIEAFVERLGMAKLGSCRRNRTIRGVPAMIRAICRDYICMGICSGCGPRAGSKPTAGATWN
jgi:hypothetical protein